MDFDYSKVSIEDIDSLIAQERGETSFKRMLCNLRSEKKEYDAVQALKSAIVEDA